MNGKLGGLTSYGRILKEEIAMLAIVLTTLSSRTYAMGRVRLVQAECKWCGLAMRRERAVTTNDRNDDGHGSAFCCWELVHRDTPALLGQRE